MAGAGKKTKPTGTKELDEDIRQKKFRRVYLFYGEETYLLQQKRRALIRAVCPEDDSMNLNIHRNGLPDFGTLQDEVLAMPFFAPYRMVVLDDTKLFRAKRKSGGKDSDPGEEAATGEDAAAQEEAGTDGESSEGGSEGSDMGAALAAFLAQIPESTVVLITELPDEKKPGGQKGKTSVDKRGKLFKAVVKYGLAVEFTAPNEQMLRTWVLGKLGAEKIRITEQTLDRFFMMTGTDMSHISSETQKLISYAGEGGVIRTKDVEALTSEILEGKIFRMLDLIAQHDRRGAIDLYNDLLEVKEPPVKILILLMRQIERLMLVRSVLDQGGSTMQVMEKLGMMRWQADQAVRQARSFTSESLRKSAERCADMQERAQSGRIDMRLGLELLILKETGGYSQRQKIVATDYSL